MSDFSYLCTNKYSLDGLHPHTGSVAIFLFCLVPIVKTEYVDLVSEKFEVISKAILGTLWDIRTECPQMQLPKVNDKGCDGRCPA